MGPGNLQPGHIIRNCLTCNKEFKVYRYRMNDPKRGKYCSKECRKHTLFGFGKPAPWTGKKRPDLLKTNAAKTMFKKGQQSPNPKKGENRLCLVCNKVFYAKRNDILRNKAKYCSRECYAKSKIGKHFFSKTQFKKGLISWNKGKTRLTDNRIYGGEKHHDWKGGITSIHERIRKSFEYEQWRKAVFDRDNYICQNCGQIGGYLQADHIKSFSLYPDLRLDTNNGRTLCYNCHRKTKTWGRRISKWALEV